MAEQAKSKIDQAAEKAYAEAASAAKPAEKIAPAAKAKPAVARKAKLKSVKIAKPAAAKAAPKKVAKPKPRVPAVAKAAAKAPAKAPAAAPATVAATAKPTPTKTPTITELKEKIMSKTTTDFTKTVKDAAAEVQTRLKAAYEKSSELVSEATEFNKGNVEALVETGKILAGAAQELGREAVEETKSAFETMTADAKKMAAIKSPTELFQLQGELARRNFDAMVAYSSKSTEKMIKLANDAFAPLSSRMSLVAEKVSKAA